ncbi:TetR/AcrR family transcriptional regulator [Lacticaseibacillus songhuajiangensis]|jgi:AcrR family transcriptional regulator|uniref:TetR/AcrR family transcriptional regulator n=1 Tax=Lacticaseibacillus songhuajiangensis TaxID=1296539 RepID=UPI000F76686D|nr:TetR/AcrR family transcriptional regulator [Lacticaseibacillus songhuajiangensis]
MANKANEVDLRSRKSKRAIGKAFVQLLADKSFETISVIEITTLAEIGQSTFYRHYRDKYDLGRHVINYFLDHFGQLYIQRLDTKGSSSSAQPSDTRYAALLAGIRVLYTINTAELNFEDCAINHIAQRIERDFLASSLDLKFPDEIAHGLATLTYCFIVNMVRRGKSYSIPELRDRIHEFQYALTELNIALRV